jgi:ubiquinone/menaquinone biosynthesis C-methylase UbiE
MDRDKIFRTLGNVGRSDLTYGRHLIKSFLHKSAPYESVLDLGAGKGDDLLIASKLCINMGGGKMLCLRELQALR